MKNLKDVNWRRSYPNRFENEKLSFVRKNWGFRLIYDVYLKQENTKVFLGSCIVKEVDNSTDYKCRTTKYVVEELVSKSLLLKKRMEDINYCIRDKFNTML